MDAIFDPNLLHLLEMLVGLSFIPFFLIVGAGYLFGVQFSLPRLCALCMFCSLPTLFFGGVAGFIIGNILLLIFLPKISSADAFLDIVLVIALANIGTIAVYARLFKISYMGSNYLTGF